MVAALPASVVAVANTATVAVVVAVVIAVIAAQAVLPRIAAMAVIGPPLIRLATTPATSLAGLS